MRLLLSWVMEDLQISLAQVVAGSFVPPRTDYCAKLCLFRRRRLLEAKRGKGPGVEERMHRNPQVERSKTEGDRCFFCVTLSYHPGFPQCIALIF